MTSARVPCRAGSCDHDRGEQLVPGGETRPLPVDNYLEPSRSRGLRAVGVGVHGGSEVREKSLLETLGQLQAPVSERCGVLLEQPGGLASGPGDASATRSDPMSRSMLTSTSAATFFSSQSIQVAKVVLPSLYFELPNTQRVRDELGSPTVVAHVGHSGLDPSSRPGLSVSEQGADRVVAVAEDIGLDRHRLPHHPLRRKSATVHLGRLGLDHDSADRGRDLRHEGRI